MVKIDRRNIFFEKLKTGINLFLGAGFSTLTSPDGSCLPVASQLCNDICEEFRINKSYSNKLEQLSTILKRNCKEEFQNYLRSRYKVKEYNSLYQTIDKIKISSIITTNIDNLIYLIIDKSKHYYLNNVEYYGAVKRDGKVIEYIPLHGDVLNLESELYFGKFELCNVENKNKGLFSMMESALLREPTIFWGYSFRDGSVNGVLNRVLENGTQDVWVQCMPGSEEINFLKDLGCNVIIGDTESLLKEIDKELSQKQENAKIIEQSDFWKKYEIPTISQVESLPKRDFYVQEKTHWFYALTRTAYVTNNVDEIIEVSFQNKNTLVIGFPFGGKLYY